MLQYLLIASLSSTHFLLIAASIERDYKYDPIIISQTQWDLFQNIPLNEWQKFIQYGVEFDDQENSLEKQLQSAQITVQNGSISHAQLLDTLPNSYAQWNGHIAERILKSSLYIYHKKCLPFGISGEYCEELLSGKELPVDTVLRGQCNELIQNRLEDSHAFARLLPRHYMDGFHKMFANLPAPLNISNQLCTGDVQSSDPNLYFEKYHRNLALVQWAQFIEHDLSKPVATSMDDGNAIECCNQENYKLQPRYHHPACAPLTKPNNLDKLGRESCLPYVRSTLTIADKCTFAAPTQFNQATAKLDLSQLYGFNAEDEELLRTHTDGMLISNKSLTVSRALLTTASNGESFNFCLPESKHKHKQAICFRAGDSRVNSNPYAIAIYTLFMRNHNRLAEELKLQHPDWHDEDLYRNARNLNTRMYRNIIYKEWLPEVLGSAYKVDLKRGNSRRHSIFNEFAVAASRFYFSLIPDDLNNSNGRLFSWTKEIYCPSFQYTSQALDDIFNALLHQQALAMDTKYANSLTTTDGDLDRYRPNHTDVLAFDIQRGRDHGLQPYIKYLELCSGVKIHQWQDLEKFISLQNINKLKMIYKNVENIDLMVGGISENTIANAIVGPTFQCIIGEQFASIYADDIKAEGHSREGTNDNDDDDDNWNWKKPTAAQLLCLNTNLEHVPNNIFQIVSEKNPLFSCHRLRRYQ